MDNRKILPKVLVLALFIILCGVIFRFLVVDTKIFYTKVSNNAIGNNKKYEYKLDSYDKDGNKKKLKFKTKSILKKGVYLKLKVSKIRGVVKGEEISYKTLPKKVKEKY